MNDMNCIVCVKNMSNNPQQYIVARLVNGELWFWGSWDDFGKATKVADEFHNGLVLERGEYNG